LPDRASPFLATLLTALVRRAGEAAVARHRPTVAQEHQKAGVGRRRYGQKTQMFSGHHTGETLEPIFRSKLADTSSQALPTAPIFVEGNTVGVRPDFVYSVSREFVRNCQTPMLVLPDDTPAHAYQVAMSHRWRRTPTFQSIPGRTRPN
jgi:hypothetical protein